MNKRQIQNLKIIDVYKRGGESPLLSTNIVGKGLFMRVLKIGNEEYTFKFDIEASLYSECTEKLTSIMVGLSDVKDKDAKSNFIKSLSDIPQTTLHMFHAGLLENHNVTLSDSKKLIAQYIREHKEDETGSFFGVMEMLIEDMAEDGFFELIGLDKMMAKAEVQTAPKPVKMPQDHKRKQTSKATEN